MALIVETGLVGTVIFAGFLLYLFHRWRHCARSAGCSPRPATFSRHGSAAGLGLTAALVGTMAANAFYLTMQFYYFSALALFILAAPIVFGRRLKTAS